MTMLQRLSGSISYNRRFIPLLATAALAIVAYGLGALFFDGMRNPQVFFNIFRNNPFLLISAVGMTFVIITGGIDLSVSGVVALTTVATAALLRDGWNPWVVILLMLAMGLALGATMGSFIAFLKVQPFIATLAGMWFARGMSFFISDDAISIDNLTFTLLARIKILIPGLTEFLTHQGKPAPFISISTIVAFTIFFAAIFIAHYTRFGRTIYAIGGNEGRNEQSARLMGLPVDTTKVLVYTMNGFCSALAGLTYSTYVASGHGLYASGFELEVIASVVMGGTMLSGGSGYIAGTLFGVWILGITQTLIQFNGSLSSWWTKIVIGLLTLVFIGVQSILMSRKARRRVQATESPAQVTARRWRYILASGLVFLLIVSAVVYVPKMVSSNKASSGVSQSDHCELRPYRQDQAALMLKDGAVVVWEKNGGPSCVDEIYAVYPDGRIVGDNGEETVEKQVTPAEVDELLAGMNSYGWFTNSLYDTWHTPCGQCFGHYVTISYNDQVKTVKGVDGGVDAPADYWQALSLVRGIVPKFSSSP